MNSENKNKQSEAPLFSAVREHIENEIIPFHVPGHKFGNGIPELMEFVGKNVMSMDLNGMHDIDYLNNPKGPIAQAEKLMADAFGAENAYFLINGTTSGIHTMIMSACKPGEKIILPRNAHKSAIAACILSGTMPVYVQPEIHPDLGIAMGIELEKVEEAIKNNPEARALLVINPTYYGIVSDLKRIVDLAHAHGLVVLVDEAHGTHLYFHKQLPITAMAAGADMSACSMHKTGGSLTQSSILLSNCPGVSSQRIRQVLNILNTSSASYLLLCSLDLARKQLATRGELLINECLEAARRAREEVNQIPGFYAFGKELEGTSGCYGFDETKLVIHLRNLDMSGYRMEDLLRIKYNIQVELADLNNILAIIGISEPKYYLESLVAALKDISQTNSFIERRKVDPPPCNPCMEVSPRTAFYSRKRRVKLKDAAGAISGENMMAYPPGIPVICMGERITEQTIRYILNLKEEHCELQGMADPKMETIFVLS